MAASQKKHFENIDALRAFAALSVLTMHVIGHTAWRDQRQPGLGWFWNAGMAVDLFYVISGFVIGYSAIAAYRRERTGFRSQFFVRRFMRIAPLFYLTNIIFVLTCDPRYLDMTNESYLYFFGTHLLFIHNWFHDSHSAMNSVGWTIGVEMQFYVFMMLLTPILSRINIYWLFIVACCISAAYRIGIYLFLFESGVTSHFTNFVWQSQFVASLEQFIGGILIARMVLGDLKFPRVNQRTGFFILAALGGMAMVGAWLFIWYIDHNDMAQRLFSLVAFKPVLTLSWMAIIGAALVFVAPKITNKAADGVQAAIGHTWIYLGKISYGIYLWHFPVITFLKRIGFGDDPWLMLILTLSVTLTLSVLSWHFFEQYFIKLGHKISVWLKRGKIDAPPSLTPHPMEAAYQKGTRP